MSSRTASRVLGSVTARLTLLYLCGSVLTLGATLLVAERSLRGQLERQVDATVTQLLAEYLDLDRKLSVTSGAARLHDMLASAFERKRAYHGAERVFLALVAPNGRLLAGSRSEPWSHLELGVPELPPAEGVVARWSPPPSHRGTRYLTWDAAPPPLTLALTTRSLGHQGARARVGFGRLSGGEVLLVAVALRDTDLVVDGLRVAFLAGLGGLFLLAGPIGYLLARRAMAGVERVTMTARRIAGEDLSYRVGLGSEGREIRDLASAFNDMLERIQTLLTELRRVSGNVAHDLRSPITRMRGIAETTLLSEGSLEEHREACGIVVEECDRLLGMTNAVLEMARMDAGAADIARGVVEMTAIAADALDLFQPLAEDKGLALEFLAPEGPLPVSGTDTMLQRALANIVDNAIKFTSAPGTVTLSAERDGDAVVISVADSGQGISPSDLPRIFERFYRADRSRSLPGSGLGLSLARSIIEAHGGHLSVESKIGDGTVFRIWLPPPDPKLWCQQQTCENPR